MIIKKYILVILYLVILNDIRGTFGNSVDPEERFLDAVRNVLRLISTTCKIVNKFQETNNFNVTHFDEVKILHFIIHEFRPYYFQNASKLLMQTEEFNLSAPTVILIHGFNNLPDEPIMKLMATNYWEKKINFLSYDTSHYIKNDYFKSAKQVPFLAKMLTDFILELIDLGMKGTQIHLIGYSLGAQIAGFVGKNLKSENIKLSRITALDPASPCFSLNQNKALNKKDALYVDVIHTSLVSFSDVQIGHADFYINGRLGIQPECFLFDVRCSHKRSIEIYTESILNEHGFPAKQCTGQLNFFKNACFGKNTTVAGYASNPFSYGVFYVETNSRKPYGLTSSQIK